MATEPTALPIWATNTGSNVVTGLAIDNINWQTGTTSTVRYTFTGSPDLSAVIVGHQLVVSGCTDNTHNGTFEITVVNNASDWIEVTNAAVTDATLDEASSPGTAIAKTGTALIQAPTSSKQAMGWLNSERPPAGYFNWFQNLVYGWLAWFDQEVTTLTASVSLKTAVATVGTTVISSSSYTAIDGAGISFALSFATTASTYTPSANDGVFETLTGTSKTLTTAANKVLLIGSMVIDVSTGTGFDFKFTDGSDRFTISDGAGNPSLERFEGIFGLSNTLSAGSNTVQFKQARYTNSNKSKIRTGAFELAPTDDNGTALVRESSIFSAGSQNLNSTSYANVTGLSNTGTFGSSRDVLLLAFGVHAPDGTGAFRFYDGTTQYGPDFLCSIDTGNNGGVIIGFAYFGPITSGAKTLTVQGKYLTGTQVQVSNNWQFVTIEFPRTVCGLTPLRYVDNANVTVTSTSSGSPDTIKATGNQAFTSSSNSIVILTGNANNSATTGIGYIRFNVDAGAMVTDWYPWQHSDSTAGAAEAFFLPIPTGNLSAGNHTLLVESYTTAANTFTLADTKLIWLELNQGDINNPPGDAGTVTLDSTGANPTKVFFDCTLLPSANVSASIALYENVNAGGDTLVRSKTMATPGTNTIPFTLEYQRETPFAAEDEVVYTVKAKIASGTLKVTDAQLGVQEIISA